MIVIKSLEKIYIPKGLGLSEYYLDGNAKFLGEAWKNQRLGLAFSARTNIQIVIPKFERICDKEFTLQDI
jgi:hypothetical protein